MGENHTLSHSFVEFPPHMMNVYNGKRHSGC